MKTLFLTLAVAAGCVSSAYAVGPTPTPQINCAQIADAAAKKAAAVAAANGGTTAAPTTTAE